MIFTDKTSDQLARIAADALAELNARNAASLASHRKFITLDDWAEFHLLKAMSDYDDGVYETFANHCHDMRVDTDGNRVDADGFVIGDGFAEQVRGDYRMAQMGAA